METQSLFTTLEQSTEQQLNEMGGKASTLARLAKRNFPVPAGAALFSKPNSLQDFELICQWWRSQGEPKVAVRSSASGEDSSDFSYAGQFLTLLQISSESELRSAIERCFASVERVSSQAYSGHFNIGEIPMHVLVQKMIQSQFSGVYFSQDPRTEESSWLVEVVEGQGEQLVSAQVTPFRFIEEDLIGSSGGQKTPKTWKPDYLQQVLHWGQQVQLALGYRVDMEWAIDENGKFWILQARPITTKGKGKSDDLINQELQKIRKCHGSDTLWDGHTFAEWTGTPTEFTFQLWKKAFSPGQAFDKALRSIGYKGISANSTVQGEVAGSEVSLLNRIFGRAYLNLKLMEPIYFGRSPYSINPNPRPHLEFQFKKLSLSILLRAPLGILQMVKVAWRVQTGRHAITQRALALIDQDSIANADPFALRAELEKLDLLSLQAKMKTLFASISEQQMQASFLITLLIESSTQGLVALLKKDLGEEKANELTLRFLGEGIKTVATEMYERLSAVAGSDDQWHSFLSKYGHRGVGELELSQPRWLELKVPRLTSSGAALRSGRNTKSELPSFAEHALSEQLKVVSKLRLPVLQQEILELKKLLVAREEIKMKVMKLYAQLRWSLLEIGRKTNLADAIFWLTPDEIETLVLQSSNLPSENAVNLQSILELAKKRKESVEALKSIDLPMSFSLSELELVLGQNQKMDMTVFHGVTLSPGVSAGRIHIVQDPATEDLNSWPEDVILVAEATDPGWTPLFERARAVVVARGGVLSHCAIVAREMGLPAVGEILGASHVFKEGERVWVDGNHGTVSKSCS